ncbi:MAG: FAD-binding protein [Candidatus Bathyarchaeia archaeon]
MEFHKVSDIIIVGAGNAGLPAAIRAKELEPETEVTVIEVHSTLASSLLMKTKYALHFTGTELQKSLGIEDSPELLCKDGVAAGGDPELWKAYTERNPWLFNWLRKMGINPMLNEISTGSIFSRPRIHWFNGPHLINTLYKEAKNRGVEILFKHRGIRLITKPETRRVIGIKVQSDGKELNFKARKAVILTTGGFGRNNELIEEFGSQWAGLCIPVLPPTHMGDGLKMALDLGAATKNISDAVVPSRSVNVDAKRLTHIDTAGAIAVDPRGKRFFNEACPRGFYGDLTAAAIKLIPEKYFWLIYDEKIKQSVSPEEYQGLKVYEGRTIEELAENAGINPVELKNTVDKYNSDLSTFGYDTLFGRKTLNGDYGTPIKIDTPPFYAMKCTASFTSFKGGVRINAKCQVLNWFNEVIPSLYAAGEIAGGFFSKGLYIGSWVTIALTTGVIAGENAIREPALPE